MTRREVKMMRSRGGSDLVKKGESKMATKQKETKQVSEAEVQAKEIEAKIKEFFSLHKHGVDGNGNKEMEKRPMLNPDKEPGHIFPECKSYCGKVRGGLSGRWAKGSCPRAPKRSVKGSEINDRLLGAKPITDAEIKANACSEAKYYERISHNLGVNLPTGWRRALTTGTITEAELLAMVNFKREQIDLEPLKKLG